MENFKQQTVAGEIMCNGIGLHSGKPVDLKLKPAPVDTGIVFIRVDLPNKPCIRAITSNITSTTKATTLSENGAEVFTIEHVMAALAMTSVDNCFVEMSSPEPPVADGSADTFVQAILKVGRVEQDKERKIYKVDKSFAFYDKDRYICVLPYDGYRITFTSINSHPMLGTQVFDLECTEEKLLKDIAPARTVAFVEELDALRKMGMGLGGTTENVVVFDADKILSVPRFEDELIRHKILDVIGDLYLLGAIKAHVIAVKTGHAFNAAVAKQIADYRKDKFEARSKKMITLDIREIQKVLPHRYPMLLVDRILDLEPMKRAVGIKNISMNEAQFMGHFPGDPIMPGIMLIEAMAQVGGVAMLYPEENRGKIAVFGKIDKVRFRKQVVPGDQLVTTAIVTKVRGTMGIISCQGTVDGELACEGEFFFAIMDPKE
ncbi:MAG: UDP-3-O-acyl-N-acetylglucosamine deacetylase [Acidaminococcaceae bacterium]|nr:UDP-3-O-acyl-N-acetylglucosamine deacetylase [Acidaminococcaceae bacterium]